MHTNPTNFVRPAIRIQLPRRDTAMDARQGAAGSAAPVANGSAGRFDTILAPAPPVPVPTGSMSPPAAPAGPCLWS
jgi:hypothetical protein